MNHAVPEDFDWISARAACSASQAFQKLRLQVESDVSKRNEIRTDNEKSKYAYQFTSEGGAFSVHLVSHLFEQMEIGVIFKRTPAGIEVYSLADQLLLQGEVTLSNGGQCRIMVAGSEYNFWQFRKLSLESVFFKDVAKWRI